MISRPATGPGPRPSSLWPPAPWLKWAWRGLFVPGHTVNQFLRFCLVGASGVLVNSAVMWGAMEYMSTPYLAASIMAFMVATVNNFTWNKLFTFADQKRGASAVAGQYARFLSVTLVGLGVNLAVLASLVELAAFPPLMGNLAGILAATMCNFLGNKYFAFQNG